MTDSAHFETFKTYQAAWADTVDLATRKQMIARSVAEGCTYTDPTYECHGHDELLAKIADANKLTPGASFRNDQFIEHHGQGLVHWTMFNGAKAEVGKGSSYVRYGGDGRMTHMSGFFVLPPKK